MRSRAEVPDIGEGSTGDPQAIADITEALRSAGRAVGVDADAVVGMFLDDPDTVLIDWLSPGVTTLPHLKQTADGLDQATDVVCEYPKVTVHVLGADLAFSMAYSHTEATLADGSRMEANTRVTNIWRKGPGGWKAIHEHSSVPVDALTGSGDLKQPI